MKEKSPPLTPLETEVMKVLWDSGPASVQAVFQQLQAVRPLAYNTVQTVLNILHRKNKVKRATRERAYIYTAVESRDRAAGQALRELAARLFGGRAEALVLNMVETRQLTPEQLARLHELVNGANGDGDGTD
jgi:predicted transcriptional regulator